MKHAFKGLRDPGKPLGATERDLPPIIMTTLKDIEGIGQSIIHYIHFQTVAFIN